MKTPSPPQIRVADPPDSRLVDQLCARLDAYNDREAPQLTRSDLFVGAHEPDGKLCGGLLASTMGGWMFIDALWVAPDRRGTGLGRDLLQTAEEVARGRGCRGAYTDSFTFQAPGFYERQGYAEFGRLEGYDGNQTRTFLRKVL
jgi:GNAT superfamily N-acetyltransferase